MLSRSTCRCSRRLKRPTLHLTTTRQPASSAAVGRKPPGNVQCTTRATGSILGTAGFYGIHTAASAVFAAPAAHESSKTEGTLRKEHTQESESGFISAEAAVEEIKQSAYPYVAWIPGGRAYIDDTFDKWEEARQSHRKEADELVRDTYNRFCDLAENGVSFEAGYELMSNLTKRVAELSGGSVQRQTLS